MLIIQERSQFEDFLKSQISEYLETDNSLNESILYSLNGGGKRIRPLFTLAFARAFGGRHAVALRCALAVEMIHTYSLIHDDLPAMDDDDLRRGKPTNHKVYGEAMAILAGDALLNLAPQYLMTELHKLGASSDLILEIVASLLEASGHNGMIMGQVLDIEAEGKAGDLAMLKTIHDKKTAALIRWSCFAGLCSTFNLEKIETHKKLVNELGSHFGVLFQVMDDISDSGQDSLVGKLTYVSLLGIDGARKEARNLVCKIQDLIKTVPGDWAMVKELLMKVSQI